MLLAAFRTKYPQFDELEDTDVQGLLDEAATEVGEAWGTFAERGRELYTAHYCAMLLKERSGDHETTIASESVARLATSRDAGMLAKQAENPFLATTYGIRYWRLLQRECHGGSALGGSLALQDASEGALDEQL